jgi:hypothetical protein
MKTIIRQLISKIPATVCKQLTNHEAFIAGGAIERLANNEKINDLDIYFRSATQAYKFLYAISGLDYKCVSHTKRSLVYKSKTDSDTILNVIIFRFFNSAEEVLSYFDYECCKAAYDFKIQQLIVSPMFWPSLQLRQLIYTSSLYPIGALIRLQKYVQRGYKPDYASILRLYKDLKALKTEDPEILEDQIGGLYGCTLDLKNLTIDQIIEKIEDTVIFEKRGEYVEVDLDNVFPELFEKRLLTLRSNEKYIVEIFKDDRTMDTVYSVDGAEPKLSSEAYNSLLNLEFPIILGKWVKYGSVCGNIVGSSYFKNSFKYPVREYIHDLSSTGVFTSFPSRKECLTYRTQQNAAWCLIRVDNPDDILKIDSQENIQIRRGFVLSIEPPVGIVQPNIVQPKLVIPDWDDEA